MKLVTFEVSTSLGATRRLGALMDGDENGRILDLTAGYTRYLASETDEPTPRERAALRTPPDMIGWMRAAHKGRKAAEQALAYAHSHPDASGLDGERLVYERRSVRLLAPIPRPGSFRDFSTYEEHMSRAIKPSVDRDKAGPSKNLAWFRTPPYAKGSPTSIRGPEDPIPWPHYTERLDLEIEIGIIVGREGRNLTVEQAKDHIAGYTILVDSSCRDGYEREPFGPTKRKDFHTAIGPCLVTADAVDPENLKCRTEVDGEVWFEGTTAAPHSFTPAHLVAYASDSETLYPGDLLGTGTISIGCSMDLHKWIRVGQVVTFTIETLGSMTFKIVEGDRIVTHVQGMEGLMLYPGTSAS